jgi:hypothetical protein
MLENALIEWQEWGFKSKPSLLRVFVQGQNHHTGLIEADGQKYVLKVLGHSFERILKSEYWANERAFSPKIIYAANNIEILEYIDDQGFTPTKLTALAGVLGSMHSAVGPHDIRFDLIAFAKEYLPNESITSIDASVHTWHQQLLPALNEFINDPTPWVFCHNDLVKENCLFDAQGKPLVIDWEYAEKHNPWFDLATVILHFELSQTQSIVFLESYRHGWSTKIFERIFISSQIAVLWIDLLWHLFTLDRKKLGRNYLSENPKRFAKLVRLAKQLDIELTPHTQ